MSKTYFDLTTIKAVVFDVDGVLSPTCVPMNADGIPQRMANLRDGYAIQLAVRSGVRIAIITGANDPAVRKRFNALGVEDVFMITGAKLPVLKEWMAKNNVSPECTAYVGDDIPDYQCMKAVALAVAPNDAAPEIKKAAAYVTTATGGHGVARELLEQILKATAKWPEVADANGL